MQAWPQRQKEGGSSRLRECFLQWKDEAHSSALVRKKMKELRLKEEPKHHESSEEASPKSQVKSASPSRKVNVDLTELHPFSLPSSPKAPNTSPEAQPDATEQRLADVEQALAESLWLSQKGQRISKVEVKVERHLRTQELLHLRLTWQAWEDLVKEKKRQADVPPEVQGGSLPAAAISPLDMALDMLKVQIPNSSTTRDALVPCKSGVAARDAGWPAARRSRPRFKAESGLSLEAAAAAAVIWLQLEEQLGEDSCQSSSSSSPDDGQIPMAQRRKRRQRYSCIVVFAPPVVR